MNETCEKCKYWDSWDGVRGNCRRYPPQPVVNEYLYFIYPKTASGDWCGEFVYATELTHDYLSRPELKD